MKTSLPSFTHTKRSLGFLPTPVVHLKNLERVLGGPRLLMKRDDQTGLGMGGNKTRKLEYLMGDCLSRGCDSVITAGAAQSNHCRQTAAAAAACGLSCHLALGGNEPENRSGNLLLDTLFGARIHWSGNMRKGENIPDIVEELKGCGNSPYVIPYGGSNECGALGFVEALFELEQQLVSLGETIDHIVFASSSGGTHSGMMVGKKMLEASYQLIGINIDKDEVYSMELGNYILMLAEKIAKKEGCSFSFSKEDCILNESYLGGGYGVIGELEKEAITLTAQHEGILLDPVYTGRAMGGMIDMIRTGQLKKNQTVLFWHTGGSPALFAYQDSLQNISI